MSLLLSVFLAANLAPVPIPGFSHCGPALFRPLPGGELSVFMKDIRYDATGRMTGYVEEMSNPTAAMPVTAHVAVLYEAAGACDGVRYSVVVAGRQVASPKAGEFKAEALEGHFALTPRDVGGIVLGGAAATDLETTRTQGPSGRSQLARQVFSSGGKRYEVAYSDVLFDALGRLSAYRAQVRSIPQER